MVVLGENMSAVGMGYETAWGESVPWEKDMAYEEEYDIKNRTVAVSNENVLVMGDADALTNQFLGGNEWLVESTARWLANATG